MSISDRSNKRRRQVFGVTLLLIAVLVLAIALWGHVRRLSYVSFALAGVGVWMLSQRHADGE